MKTSLQLVLPRCQFHYLSNQNQPFFTTKSSFSSHKHGLYHGGAGFDSDMKFPVISRTTNNLLRSSRFPRFYCVNNRIAPHSIMSDQETTKSQSTTTSEKEVKTVKIPTPPEKPLPGDCCGSGCVRCVWDIYYEELDEYNKTLAKIKSELPESNSKHSS